VHFLALVFLINLQVTFVFSTLLLLLSGTFVPPLSLGYSKQKYRIIGKEAAMAKEW